MPVALLISEVGDARDAVGLFLAGKGWTTAPAAQDPEAFAQELELVQPELVVIDFRGDAEAARACAELAAAGSRHPVVLINVPAGQEEIAGTTVATEPDDLPRAPGVPEPPH